MWIEIIPNRPVNCDNVTSFNARAEGVSIRFRTREMLIFTNTPEDAEAVIGIILNALERGRDTLIRWEAFEQYIDEVQDKPTFDVDDIT